MKNIGNKELYLYPSYPFNEQEEQKCYTILVVGQTGILNSIILLFFPI